MPKKNYLTAGKSQPGVSRDGRKPLKFRKTIDGIWWIMVTGCQWNQLPKRDGLWKSVYRFHLRWVHRGLFKKLLQQHAEKMGNDGRKVLDATHIKVHQNACHFAGDPEVEGIGKTKGGRNSKLSAVTNGAGKALNIDLMAGKKADITAAIRVRGDVTTDQVVLSDKGYNSDKLRQIL